MFIEAIIIGLLFGIFRGGRASQISDMNFRGWYLIIIALLIQISPVIFNRFGVLQPYYKYLVFAGSVLMFLILIFNIDKKGAWIISIGALLNLIVIGANGFAMPVLIESLNGIGFESFAQSVIDGSVFNYVALDNINGYLDYLSKFIGVGAPYPFPRILSIGDILISFGLFYMIQGELNRPMFTRGSKMIQYSYKFR